MRFTTIFFDLDDTLYPSSTNLWLAIKGRMNEFMRDRLNIPTDEIPALREKYYMQYGTTLKGLEKHHQINVDDFLAYVHDLPLGNYLTPDTAQREVIASLPTRNLIFTNADSSHAERVLTQLNLRDLFPIIVDVNAVTPYCKPMSEAFKLATTSASGAYSRIRSFISLIVSSGSFPAPTFLASQYALVSPAFERRSRSIIRNANTSASRIISRTALGALAAKRTTTAISSGIVDAIRSRRENLAATSTTDSRSRPRLLKASLSLGLMRLA